VSWNRRAFVLDIETIPEGLAFGETIQIPEPFAGLDDPEEAERLYLRQALHPRKCQIIAWALIPLLGGDPIVQIGPDEDGLLDALAAYVAPSRDVPAVLAWNGPGFDFPVLRARALVHGRQRLASVFAPQVWAGHGIRYPERLLDLMRLAPECLPGRYVSKAAAAEAWGVPIQTPPGSTVPYLWAGGHLGRIEAHVVEDVLVERHLAELWDVAEILGVQR
jgi:hypothetical protein